MKIKTVLAAAVIASASTASFAGNTFVSAETVPVSMPAPATDSPSRIPPILYPIAACLLLCGLGGGGGS